MLRHALEPGVQAVSEQPLQTFAQKPDAEQDEGDATRNIEKNHEKLEPGYGQAGPALQTKLAAEVYRGRPIAGP
jgi:hypothetical protein